jgi:uncharacterized integral membrane protein
MKAKLIAIVVLLMLLLIFAIQNGQTVVLNFLFWQISTSSVLSILGSFMIGVLTGCLLMMIGRMKKKGAGSVPHQGDPGQREGPETQWGS